MEFKDDITRPAIVTDDESLSGFSSAFKAISGVSPNNSKTHKIIDLKRIESPLGALWACAVDEGVCILDFADRKILETNLESLAKQLKATIVQGNSKYLDELEQQLNEYFEGDRKVFTVKLFIHGSEFQQSVWSALQNIPYGSTISYKEQAAAIGKPEAVRAVAGTNGMNRIAIVIPCHRVIGSNGKLTGYSGGVWRKNYLIELEQKYSRI